MSRELSNELIRNVNVIAKKFSDFSELIKGPWQPSSKQRLLKRSKSVSMIYWGVGLCFKDCVKIWVIVILNLIIQIEIDLTWLPVILLVSIKHSRRDWSVRHQSRDWASSPCLAHSTFDPRQTTLSAPRGRGASTHQSLAVNVNLGT